MRSSGHDTPIVQTSSGRWATMTIFLFWERTSCTFRARQAPVESFEGTTRENPRMMLCAAVQ